MMTYYEELGAPLDIQIAREQIKHPRCAIIPSPDKLNTSSSSPGLDAIYTQSDFNDVWRWAREAGILNIGFFADVVDIGRGQLEKTVYDRLRLAAHLIEELHIKIIKELYSLSCYIIFFYNLYGIAPASPS